MDDCPHAHSGAFSGLHARGTVRERSYRGLVWRGKGFRKRFTRRKNTRLSLLLLGLFAFVSMASTPSLADEALKKIQLVVGDCEGRCKPHQGIMTYRHDGGDTP